MEEPLAPWRSHPVAATLAAIAIALTVPALWFAWASWHVPRPTQSFGPRLFPATIAFECLLVGLLLTSRRPANFTGWALLLGAVAAGLQQLSSSYALWAVAGRGSASTVARLAATGEDWIWMSGFTALAYVLAVFPDGLGVSRRWSRYVRACVVLSLLGAVSLGLTEKTLIYPDVVNPLSVPGMFVLGTALSASFFLLLVSAFVRLVVHLRRSVGDEREQMKWLAYSASIIVASFAVYLIAYAFDPDSSTGLANALEMGVDIGVTTVPVAIGIGILKYRLYDIDIVISKTVVYGSLAVFITSVYVAIVAGVGTLAGGRGGPLLSGAAAAIVAVAFQPARRAAERLANRLVYGKRASPYEVLSEFAGKMSQAYSLEDVTSRLARLVADGTGAERASVWLRDSTGFREQASTAGVADRTLPAVDEEPGFPPGEHGVIVHHHGEVLGAISLIMPPSEPYTEAQQRLLTDVAAQAGLVLRNVRLVVELRESRRRIVSAQDERARKLERNLHDGAQQQLVALAVRQRLAAGLIDKDPAAARSMLDEIQRGTNEALETLRDLARGIYPPLLAEKGLAVALEAQARRSALPVTVSSDSIGRYGQETEAAVYFTVLEALQNAAKYSGASRVSVRLNEDDGRLVFEVEDDGRGFDMQATASGSGIRGMSDRIAAVGGELQVRSSPGGGTRIQGIMPVFTSSG